MTLSNRILRMSVYIVAKKEKDFSAIIASTVAERRKKRFVVLFSFFPYSHSLSDVFFMFNISGRCLHTCAADFFSLSFFFSFSLSFRFYTFFTFKIFPVRRLLINILFFSINRKSLSSQSILLCTRRSDGYIGIFFSLFLYEVIDLIIRMRKRERKINESHPIRRK